MIQIPLRDGSTWDVTDTDIEMRQAAYPGVDVAQEYQKMAQWAEANPRKRKTARGINAFVVNWLNRVEPARKKPDTYAAAHKKFEAEKPKVMSKEVGMAALAALKRR